MGAGLQVLGSQTAVIAEVEGKLAVIEPALLTAMLPGFVVT
jgi:hypothetical protein